MKNISYYKQEKNNKTMFIKYFIGSISSSMIDILLFSLLVLFFKKTRLSISNYIIISTIIARIISSTYNFLINHKYVFKSKESKKTTSTKYFSLVVVQGLLSGILVSIIVNITLSSETIIKIFVDIILFFLSYYIQKKYIFKNKNIDKKY